MRTEAPPLSGDRRRRFQQAYANHRAAEGRADLNPACLPNVHPSRHAREWRVRAASYETFHQMMLSRCAELTQKRLRMLDLGSGNGWLCHRMRTLGHDAIALDLRVDHVDGLGAATDIARDSVLGFPRIAASYDALPLAASSMDVVVFNASLHYATNLQAPLVEAARVTHAKGAIMIMDSPFYIRTEDGQAMVTEKRLTANDVFGSSAPELIHHPFVEFLTCDRLCHASYGLGLRWVRHRVLYPMWYELRSEVARIRHRRCPSRFDIWEGTFARP